VVDQLKILRTPVLDRATYGLRMSSVRKYMKAYLLSVLCSLVEQMLSGWPVASRHLSRKLAYARISISYRFRSSGDVWNLPTLQKFLPGAGK
jgi:hypothetical protein